MKNKPTKLEDCKNVGEYADLQTEILGTEECKKLQQDFTKKKDMLSRKLNWGQSINLYPELLTATLTKKQAKDKKINRIKKLLQTPCPTFPDCTDLTGQGAKIACICEQKKIAEEYLKGYENNE
jgi:hypothetical protein